MNASASRASSIATALLAIYTVSGVAALAYQVLWARFLGTQFGVSTFGVAISAAAFMLGLGLGSLIGANLTARLVRPLRVFALLEGVVALYALVLPLLQQTLDQALAPYLTGAPLATWYVVQGVVGLVCLSVPTFAMGIGFPMVLRAARAADISLATVYGVNTLGGATGALLPLLLLPLLGWQSALLVVATMGLGVAVAAYVLDARIHRTAQTLDHYDVLSATTRPPASWLWVYAGVGFAALLLEVAWVRLYGMIFLRTEYVMAIILFVYLAGIGAGSLFARWLNPRTWLPWFPAFIAVSVALGLWLLPVVARWNDAAQVDSLSAALWTQGGMLALSVIWPTLLLGAWLPMLSTLHAQPRSGPWLYGANSIGAACGALFAAYVMIPSVGTVGSIVAAAVMLSVLALRWATPGSSWSVLALLLLWPVAQLPPARLLQPSAQADTHDRYIYEDAVALTHVTERADGQRLLLDDLQRMDAASDPAAVLAQQNQVRLPLLLHSNPTSVLFVGLGTGISAGASLYDAQLTRTAVELSQGAIHAARDWFAPVNGNILDHATVVHDDARRFLAATEQRFDVIIGDLFHPDLIGRSTLLSRQQFARSKARLNDGGVFVQWVAINQFDAATLQIVWRTFAAEFPAAVAFVDGFRMALVGTRDRRIDANAMLGKRGADIDQQQLAMTGQEGPWTWLGRYWGALSVGPGAVQDEWWPQIEYRLPRIRYEANVLAQTLAWLFAQRPRADIAAQQLGVTPSQFDQFERAYAATELAARSWHAAVRGDALGAQRLLRLAHQANDRDRWVASALADYMYDSLPQAVAAGMNESQALDTVLAIYPDHVPSVRRKWQVERSAASPQAQVWGERLRALSPLDAALRGTTQRDGSHSTQ